MLIQKLDILFFRSNIKNLSSFFPFKYGQIRHGWRNITIKNTLTLYLTHSWCQEYITRPTWIYAD
jgi:hypothetical protein